MVDVPGGANDNRLHAKASIAGQDRQITRASVTRCLSLSRWNLSYTQECVPHRPLRRLPDLNHLEHDHRRIGDCNPDAHGLDWQPGPRPNKQAHHLLLLVTPPAVRNGQGRLPKQLTSRIMNSVRLKARQLMTGRAEGKKLTAGTMPPATRRVKYPGKTGLCETNFL